MLVTAGIVLALIVIALLVIQLISSKPSSFTRCGTCKYWRALPGPQRYDRTGSCFKMPRPLHLRCRTVRESEGGRCKDWTVIGG